jgi:uncharacterized protein YndB with AHSA1/START domain
MTVLSQSLERTVFIRATPDTVFRFFTDSVRWASWWGAGSSIDPTPGGAVLIRHPNGVEVTGEVLEIVAPERLTFTYGFASGTPMPPGASRVTIALDPQGDGTRLTLTHQFADAAMRDRHLQGWRYQLSIFSNVVLHEITARAGDTVDAWFGAWALTDATAREAALAPLITAGLQYRDRYSALEGLADLVAQIGAVQQYMPDHRFERYGPIRDCQGQVLADWRALAADGQQRASGTAAFTFAADGRIASVVSFWV